MLVGVTNDPIDAGKGRNLLGRTLGIAASYKDFCRGIFALCFSDCGSCVLIGCGSNSTSVEYEKVRLFSRFCPVEASSYQLPFNRGAIGLSGPASKVLHKKGAHRGIITISGTLLCGTASPQPLSCRQHQTTSASRRNLSLEFS